MTISRFFKIILCSIFIALSIPASASIMADPVRTEKAPADSAADARLAAHIIQRVAEIQNMDKTNLTAAEKSDLRKELMTMKKQGGKLDKKVYLSIGAIIIIILLLILILR